MSPPPHTSPAPLRLVPSDENDEPGAPAAPPARDAGTPPSDDELVELAAGGDQQAFESLVRRHQAKVLGFARRFFGQEAIALDVAQDAFVDLLRALPRYRPEGRFSVYMYRIVLNRCRMAARSFRVEDRARQRLFVSRPDPVHADQAAARDAERRLQRALAGLSEKHRAVLQLRFWGELPLDEIAAVLEVPEGTVKSRLFHALADLRERLGDIA